MSDFWQDQRVVVTGGAGFLGAFVVERLRAAGAGAISVPRKAQYDLRERTAIRDLLHATRPTMVIHLAATVGGIGANRDRPAEFFYENLMMSAQLLDEAHRVGVAKFVGIGTICEYPKITPLPFHEDNLWDGYPEETNAPYGIAKRALLTQSQAYRQQYGFNAIHLMPVNLYGPRDNFDLKTSHVIPALIRKSMEAKARGDHEIVVWGDGTPTREFLYVEDAAEAIVMAAERYNDGDPVNLGSGTEISIRDLVNTITRLVGFEGDLVWDTDKPNGQPRRRLDVQRAQERFGFKAHTAFEDGLRKTVEWYQAQVMTTESSAGISAHRG
ncbi:MAG: GDP-L-fucose synthase [Chloroflexota bacterium]|nr:GDP-L-fucose synthase [Chloroflexota bacterium]